MKSKTFKIVFTLAIVLGIVLIGYTVFAAQTQNKRQGQNLTIQQKEEIVDKRVKEGTVTTDQAKEIKSKLQNCNPENPQRIGQEYKLGFGRTEGTKGNGVGQSEQKGRGLRNGTCKLSERQ